LTFTQEILYIIFMFGIRIIIPAKIISARGGRTRKQIADASHDKITEQDIYNWEKGLNLPRIDKQPYLLRALGVSFEEISEEISTDSVA